MVILEKEVDVECAWKKGIKVLAKSFKSTLFEHVVGREVERFLGFVRNGVVSKKGESKKVYDILVTLKVSNVT